MTSRREVARLLNEGRRRSSGSGGFVATFCDRIASRRLFVALMLAELCALYILEWPLYYSFNNFAFWDWGGYLITHYLLQHGYHPTKDFAWQYGLLPLLIQELWFASFQQPRPRSSS